MLRFLWIVFITFQVPQGLFAQEPKSPPSTISRSIDLSDLFHEVLDLFEDLQPKFTLKEAEVAFWPSTETLGFEAPASVTVKGVDSLGGIPGTEISMRMKVRCRIAVNYPIGDLKKENGKIVLPPPSISASYMDPPGQRGTFEYQCGPLRTKWTPWDLETLNHMKYRLQEEALLQAVREFRATEFYKRERDFVEKLQRKKQPAN